MRLSTTAVLVCALAGCDGDKIFVADPPPDGGVFPDAAPPADAGFPDAGFADAAEPPPAKEPVYIQTGDTLFTFDPDDDSTVEVGKFASDAGAIDNVVDIAIDLAGRLFAGTSDQDVYQCDPETAFCRFRFHFDDKLHGLTFLSDGRLVVAGERVTVVEPQTGRPMSELAAANNYETSGDVVGLPDGKLYWTVRNADRNAGDGVVQLDPRGGSRWLGAARVTKIYGLGYANGQLIGFSDEGYVVRLDPTSGRVLDLRMLPGRWWGATTNPVLWN